MNDISEITAEKLIQSSTKAVRFFLDWKLACAGCGFARFCTLENIVKTYQLDEEKFLEEAQALTRSDNTPRSLE